MISVIVRFNRFGQIARQARAAVQEAVSESAAAIEGGAKERAPVDTGFLLNSIGFEMTGDAEAHVTAGAEYAAYVEFGTHKMAAQPYMTPSAEAERPNFPERIARKLR